MNDTRKYVCSRCGQVHQGCPVLAFSSPTLYNHLSQIEKQQIGELSEDLCIVKHIVRTFTFIPGTLIIRVSDHCNNLEYGVWILVSQHDFEDYFSNRDNPNHEALYYGWLGNVLPGYKQTERIL